MATGPTIVWLRRDLRTDDHAALTAAAERGARVIPVVFVHLERFGSAAAWWLHHSLSALAVELAELGGRLVVRSGPAVDGLIRLAAETGAAHIDYNRHIRPADRADEAQLAAMVGAAVTVTGHRTGNLFEPGEVLTGGGSPYLIYTPFAKACLRAPTCPRPLQAPLRLAWPEQWPGSVDLTSLDLTSAVGVCCGLGHQWEPGPRGAARRVRWLIERRIKHYHTERDRPDLHSTSGLSPHLAFGELSARRLWHAVLHSRGDKPYTELPEGHRRLLDELLWREFAQHTLYHLPHLEQQPLRPRAGDLAWRRDEAGLNSWQRGLTGYPIVDAGMRQLLRLGWIHNRVRMVVASFLVKDLLIDWRHGARYFADRLVDYDEASNGLNWQWAAGSGVDSSPFTRVFNPVTQGARFDPEGRYVRRWVPELAQLPDEVIHAPWAASPTTLAAAGVRLGDTYPLPIVDHATARRRALDAYSAARETEPDGS
ncbi:MAG: deoxyribodipyrimidine photo-lyase [Armatimonadetes bacterium]|nr:deoxyribodipyrimidine photo-lyase [Armatimonadota bacterium]